MNVSITVRHTRVSSSVQARTEELVRKLEKFDSRVSRAEVVFDEEGGLTTVEGILYIDREDPAVAKASDADAKNAVDLMIDRLGRILRRRRSQARDHRGARRAVTEPDLGDA